MNLVAKVFNYLKRATCLLAFTAAGLTAGLADEGPTVALVDFSSADGPVDCAILGVADLLEAELSRYDELQLVSRREVNLLLSERGLARKGFARMEDLQNNTLPWADFLLRGEYSSSGGTGPAVMLHLAAAATGIEQGQWTLRAVSQSAVLQEIEGIVPQIITAISGRQAIPNANRSTSGFTAIPEAASTFYRGLDHLVAGRPEYAAEYFRLAAVNDSGFTLAMRAQAKAFEQLGFPRIATKLLDHLPEGQMPEGQAANTGDVLTVRFVERSDTFTARTMDAIRSCLQEEHGFTLFEPDWIPALTRETDLKLTGDFPLVHGLDSRLWLRADNLMVFSAEEAGLRVHVIDLVHGRLLGTASDNSQHVGRLCAQAKACARRSSELPQEMPATQSVATNQPAFHMTAAYSVDEVTFALRRCAEDRKDMARWTHLLNAVPWNEENQILLHALLDECKAAIPPDSPDAPLWLASLGWGHWMLDAQVTGEPPPLAAYFPELLAGHPDHLQTQVVRFHMALAMMWRGDFKLGWPLAIEVAEKAAPVVAEMDDFVAVPGLYLDVIDRFDDSKPPAIPPLGFNMTALARDMYALAAYLSWKNSDTALAGNYLAKATSQQTRQFDGLRARKAMPQVALYPVSNGIWSMRQSRFNFAWSPPAPEDAAHVLVGWTFQPFPAESLGFDTKGMGSMTMLQITQDGLAMAGRPPSEAGLMVAVPAFDASHRNTKNALCDFSHGSMLSNDLGGQPEMERHQRAFLKQYTEQLQAWVQEHVEPRRSDAPLPAAWQAYQDEVLGPTFGTRRYYGHDFSGALMVMYWMTAGTQQRVGAHDAARQTCRAAYAWGCSTAHLPSIRYMEAASAHAAGDDDEAATILWELAADPKSSTFPLHAAEVPHQRGLIVDECAALLTAMGKSTTPEAPLATAALPPIDVPFPEHFPHDAVDAWNLFTRRIELAFRQGGYAAQAQYAREFMERYAKEVSEESAREAAFEAERQATIKAEGKESWAQIMHQYAKSMEGDGRSYGPEGPPDPNKAVLQMYFAVAGSEEQAGQRSKALATCREATEWPVWYPIRLSIHYYEACLVHRDGQDFEASEILRALAEDPRSKDAQLRMPEPPSRRDTVYAESVALLDAIRRDTGAATPVARRVQPTSDRAL